MWEVAHGDWDWAALIYSLLVYLIINFVCVSQQHSLIRRKCWWRVIVIIYFFKFVSNKIASDHTLYSLNIQKSSRNIQYCDLKMCDMFFDDNDNNCRSIFAIHIIFRGIFCNILIMWFISNHVCYNSFRIYLSCTTTIIRCSVNYFMFFYINTA